MDLPVVLVGENPGASVAEIKKRSRKAETRGYYKSYDL